MERKNRCCVATCQGERFDLAHKFPRSSEVAECWLQAIDNPNLKNFNFRKLSECYQVCARHFRITDYKHPQSRSLNKLAVPSLNLKNLNQLHLARDSTHRPTENILLESDASSVLSKNGPPPTSSANENVFLKSSNVLSESDSPSIQVAVEVEDYDSMELVECIEMTSSESQIDSMNNKSEVGEEKQITLKVTDFSTVFEIKHPKYEKPLYLNAFSLRFNCTCLDCYDSEKKRRKFTLMDIPRNIQPKAINKLGSVDTILIEWQDGHYSTHDLEFLYKIEAPEEKLFLKKLHFDSTTFKKSPHIEFSKLVCFDDKIEKIFKNLILHGFVFVTGISTQNSSMAKLAIQRLFPHQQTVHFEPFNETHSDICTNFTCANIDCGLKVFFATHKAEIILVDGLNIADKVKQSDAYAFKTLTSTVVQMKMRDNSVYHEKSGPIIDIDDEMEENTRIQLDTQRMGSLMLPQVEIQNFYDSLELFMNIIRTNKNQILLTLEPGTIIILDNWRVLHKLMSSGGIFQCYLGRRDYIGRSKYLGLL